MSSLSGEPRPGASEPGSDGRLDSWKEIAAYLRRSVRSAKRWEKEEGLPVHRHLHGKRDSVYAYRGELDGWWNNRGTKLGDQNGGEDPASSPEEVPDVSSVEEPEREEEVSSLSSRPPRGAALVGVGLALVAVLVGVISWLSRNSSGASAGSVKPLPFKARDWVLVAGFDNRTGEKLLDGTLEYALTRELSNSRFVNVVPRERIGDALRLMRKPPDTALNASIGREVCLRDGEIRALLIGRVEKTGTKYVLSVEILEPKRGAMLASFHEEASGNEASLAAVGRISDRVRTSLGETPLPESSEKAGLAKVTTTNLRALHLYSRADFLFWNNASVEEGRINCSAAEELLRQAVAEDPQFASAYILLAYSIQRQNRPLEDYRAYLETAFRLADTTTDRERYLIRGNYYVLLDQREKAIAAYEALLSMYPDDDWALNLLPGLYAMKNITRAVQLEQSLADGRPKEFGANWHAAYNSVRWNQDPAPAQPYFRRAREAVTPEILERFTYYVAWMDLWPATAHWLKGDLAATANELEGVSTKIEALHNDSRNLFWAILASDYLTLGNIVTVEKVSRRILNPALRSGILAQVAFLKGDAAGLRGLLQHGSLETETLWRVVLTPILLQTRAGLLPEAQRRLKELEERIGKLGYLSRPGELEILRGEIAFARGDLESAIRELEEGTRLAQDLGRRPQFHLGSETLATALMKKGDARRAIEILERASERKFLAAVSNDSAVPYWMRNRLDLAKLYRHAGRIKDAQAIEADLSKLLTLADPDYPIRRELDRLKGS